LLPEALVIEQTGLLAWLYSPDSANGAGIIEYRRVEDHLPNPKTGPSPPPFHNRTCRSYVGQCDDEGFNKLVCLGSSSCMLRRILSSEMGAPGKIGATTIEGACTLLKEMPSHDTMGDYASSDEAAISSRNLICVTNQSNTLGVEQALLKSTINLGLRSVATSHTVVHAHPRNPGRSSPSLACLESCTAMYQ
jgi:hypothetical protein